MLTCFLWSALLVPRFCLKNCPANDLECDLSTYALEYKLLSLPFGIAAGQDLIRLVAYTHDQVMHPRTTFLMADEDPAIPFALRDENLKGVVYTTRPLREPKTYRMGVRALSYGIDGNVEYRTTFIVYIAVSAYPYWAPKWLDSNCGVLTMSVRACGCYHSHSASAACQTVMNSLSWKWCYTLFFFPPSARLPMQCSYSNSRGESMALRTCYHLLYLLHWSSHFPPSVLKTSRKIQVCAEVCGQSGKQGAASVASN